MSAINDGGPAFPVPNDANVNGQEGITLRDWFAGQALPAVLAAYVEANGRCIGTDHIMRNPPIIAYQMADAMLAARGKS